MTQGLGHVTVNTHLVGPLARLVDVPIKVTVVLAVALMLDRIVRRAEARTRHALLTVALLGALVMPLISRVTPQWHLELWPASSTWLTTRAERHTESSGSPVAGAAGQVPIHSASGPGGTPQLGRADPAPPTPTATRLRIPWSGLILGVWVAGSVIMLGRLALGVARVTRLARNGTPLCGDHWRGVTARLISEGQLPKRIRLLENREVSVPFTCGLFRPVILLPTEVESWSSHRRRLVLLHELAHIRRNDWLIQIMAQFACAAYWFNPLTWIATRHLRAEQEQACDERVVLLGARPSAYAAHLLDIARSMTRDHALPVATWATTHSGILARRVQSVLKPRGFRRRGAAPSPIAQVGMATVVLFVAILAPTGSRPWKHTLPVVIGGDLDTCLFLDTALPATLNGVGGTAELEHSVDAGWRYVLSYQNNLAGTYTGRPEQRLALTLAPTTFETISSRIAQRIHARAEDRAHDRAEDPVLRCISETISRTIAKSIAKSISAGMAVHTDFDSFDSSRSPGRRDFSR